MKSIITKILSSLLILLIFSGCMTINAEEPESTEEETVVEDNETELREDNISTEDNSIDKNDIIDEDNSEDNEINNGENTLDEESIENDIYVFEQLENTEIQTENINYVYNDEFSLLGSGYTNTIKYAVAIYGIEHDIDQYDNTMGLTFGPATGANYIDSYQSHSPTGNTSSGNPHRCVHNDSWETIILWNNTDPYVYEQCISGHCTHSVELTLNSDLANPSFSGTSSGDGPSVLYAEIEGNSAQHLRWNPLTGVSSDGEANTYGSTKDGWAGSRVRAMLNGTDAYTQTGTNYASSIPAAQRPTFEVSQYTLNNCLFSCFPSILQSAIGKRKTIFNKSRNSNNYDYTYDNLFLFSIREICDTTEAYGGSEGTEYPRMVGSGAYNSTSSIRIAYAFPTSYWDGTLLGPLDYWLRSKTNIQNNVWDECRAARITMNGTYNQIAATRNPLGVSPAFALKEETVSYNITIPTTLNLNNASTITGNYDISNGYASVSVSSQNNFKLKDSSNNEILYSLSQNSWNTLTGSGTLNTIVSIESGIPSQSNVYSDLLTFTISLGSNN